MPITTINLGISLSGLSDVDVTGINNGDILVWNSVTGKFEVQADGGANFANANLTFTGNRAHDTNGNNLEITTDNGGYAEGFFALSSANATIGRGGNYLWADASSVFIRTGGSARLLVDTTGQVGIGQTTMGARLDVKAPGALSTDIPFRIRNSADTADIFKTNGLGQVWSNGRGGVSSNTAFGENVFSASTSGDFNTAVGKSAMGSLTTGLNNTAIGYASLYGITTQNNNTAVGYNSGRYIADGVTVNTGASQGLYLGMLTKASAVSQTNEIVIGYNATGLGSNTAVLGNDSISRTYLKGGVVVGTESALATTATNGFLWIPTCAGTPTGTPTGVTNKAAMIADTTNNKLYVYLGGAWVAMN